MASPVIVLDLRQGASALAGAAGLRAAVAERLREAGRPEPADEHYRFLLIDTPAGLGLRHSVYERVIAYGKRTSVLALAVGELAEPPQPQAPDTAAGGGSWDPLAMPGETEAWNLLAAPREPEAADAWNPGPDLDPDPPRPVHHGPRLTRPAALRGESCGLLWAGDLRAARVPGDPDVTPDDPRALSVLVDVLCGLFDDVLDRLTDLTDSVAVPAVRFLEHDLSPAARDRAWTDALHRLAGDPGQPPPDGTLDLGDLLTGHGADVRPAPGSRLDRSRAHCARTLTALDRARRGGAPAAALGDTAEALEHHRALIAEVLRHDDPPAGEVTLAPSTLTREDLARALRAATEQLLDRGAPLRAVAARLVVLAEEVLPGSAGELADEADRRCPPDRIRRINPQQPFTVRPNLPLALLAGAASGLVPLGAPVVLAALWAGLRHLRAGLLATAAFLPGAAAAGFLASRALSLPAWTPAPALACGLLAAWLPARTSRKAAADDWWRASGADDARRVLTDLDTLLAQGAARRWWAAAHRRDLADLARADAGLLRAAADTAQECAGVPRPRQGAYDSLGEGLRLVPPDLSDGPGESASDVPRWLGREAGEGGPALVATLRDDLDAAVRTALRRHTGGGRGDTDVRALFADARRHLDRHGVVAPSPHRPGESRPDTEALLGVAAREPDDDTTALVELVTPEQSALLSKDPGQTRRIRFAPHTARRPAWATDQPVLFPGRYSGTLRLKPLRHGVIRTVRRFAADAETEGTW